MEVIARHAADLELLIAVIARDLGSPYQYLSLAEACLEYRREDLALEWAVRGLDAFPHDRDERLTERAAELLLRAGRTDEAVAAARAQLLHRATSTAWDAFERAGRASDQWPAAREGALEALRAAGDTDALVTVLLHIGEHTEAWSAAKRSGVTRATWRALARRGAEGHPEDAIVVWRRELDDELVPATDGAYRRVAAILEDLRPLYRAAGRPGEWTALVAAVKDEYRRRPSSSRASTSSPTDPFSVCAPLSGYRYSIGQSTSRTAPRAASDCRSAVKPATEKHASCAAETSWPAAASSDRARRRARQVALTHHLADLGFAEQPHDPTVVERNDVELQHRALSRIANLGGSDDGHRTDRVREALLEDPCPAQLLEGRA